MPCDFTVFVPFVSVVVFLVTLPFFLFFLPPLAFGVAFVFLGLTRFPDTLLVGAKRKDGWDGWEGWEGWDDVSTFGAAASATSAFTNANASGSNAFVVGGPALGFGETWQSQ